MLLQYPDDLFFRKAIALHALVLKMGQNELQTGLAQRGKVTLHALVLKMGQNELQTGLAQRGKVKLNCRIRSLKL
jgi:hypothetical protein